MYRFSCETIIKIFLILNFLNITTAQFDLQPMILTILNIANDKLEDYENGEIALEKKEEMINNLVTELPKLTTQALKADQKSNIKTHRNPPKAGIRNQASGNDEEIELNDVEDPGKDEEKENSLDPPIDPPEDQPEDQPEDPPEDPPDDPPEDPPEDTPEESTEAPPVTVKTTTTIKPTTKKPKKKSNKHRNNLDNSYPYPVPVPVPVPMPMSGLLVPAMPLGQQMSMYSQYMPQQSLVMAQPSMVMAQQTAALVPQAASYGNAMMSGYYPAG